VAIAVAAFLGGAVAQEHPKEHPSEHPKDQPKAEAAKPLTVEELAAAVDAWVKSESAKTGGALEVKDSVQGKTLRLVLEKVHKEKLSTIGPKTHFVCADFKGDDGHTYDVDVFMKGRGKDHLKTTEVTVHKMDGKERYTWMEKDGVWSKKPIGGAEHPEHPKGEHPKEPPK
jgi:hypothetical protein